MSALRLLQARLAEPKAAHRLLLALIGLCTVATLWYVYRVGMDSISRDEWRFIEMLRHWYGGQFSLADIWSTNTTGSEHRVPAFKLYFLADALWFGLDVRLGCYLGVLALGLFVWLIYRYFLRTAPTGDAVAMDHYAFAPVAITMVSFTQSHIYSYDLLAMFTIIGSMLFAALWMQMDLKLRTPQPAWRYALYALLLLVLLLNFGAGKNPALTLATLALAAGIALQSRYAGRSGNSVAWKVMGWIAGGALLAELIYFWDGAGKEGSDMVALLGNVLGDPDGAVEYALHALGAALVTTDALSVLPAAERAGRLELYGLAVLGGTLAALVLYLGLRGYRRALLPLILAVFAAGYLGELVVGRFGGGTENGGAPRYVYTDHLLVVACVFVFADTARSLYHHGRRQIGLGLLALLMFGVCWVETYNLRVEYRSIPSQLRTQDAAVSAARTRLAGGQAAYPRWYCPDDQLCDDDVTFLAEHHLSLVRMLPVDRDPGSAP
jgi:hypothetical protein